MPNCFFCYREAPEGQTYHPACCRRFFNSVKLPRLDLNEKLLKELALRTVNDRIALTGVQPKLSLTMDGLRDERRLTIVGLWGEYILKPQHKGFGQMPENEDLTMHLASLFSLPTCAHALIPTTEGEMVYLAKRFDREDGRKLHIEDLCQLAEFQTEQKYDSSYEFCGKLIRRYATHGGLDVLNLFELIVFSFLTGNNDMHLKNFSLMHGDGNIMMSPAYDLINARLVNPKDREDTALLLDGRRKKLNREHFERLAVSFKLPANVPARIFKKYLSAEDDVFSLIERSFLSEQNKQQYMNIWRENARRLAG